LCCRSLTCEPKLGRCRSDRRRHDTHPHARNDLRLVRPHHSAQAHPQQPQEDQVAASQPAHG